MPPQAKTSADATRLVRRNSEARHVLNGCYEHYVRYHLVRPTLVRDLRVPFTATTTAAAVTLLVQKGLLRTEDGGRSVTLTNDGITASQNEDVLHAVLPVVFSHAAKPVPKEKSVSKQVLTNPRPDPRKVFVIHGRNLDARKEMGTYLLSMGLEPINFGDLRASLKGTPTIKEIVMEGMRRAHGVVALFTADEYAELHPDLREDGESGESIARWQSRPNVIFETGIAFGQNPDNVVLVKLGRVALFTDLAGIHVVSPTNQIKGDRSTLRKILKAMGCAVNDSDDWHDHGDFEGPIKKLPEVSPRSPFRD